jgi:hypothetical protein
MDVQALRPEERQRDTHPPHTNRNTMSGYNRLNDFEVRGVPVKTMAEVLSAHWSASTHTERKPFVDKCDGCGAVIFSWGDPTVNIGPERLAIHQADALTAAGFGPVKEAQAAWADGYKLGLLRGARARGATIEATQ